MNDLDIIKEIEKILKIELVKEAEVDLYFRGYTLNKNSRVIALGLAGYNIKNLKRIIIPLSKLTELTKLVLWSNQLKDITPIKELNQLTLLNLSDNQLTDITPIKGLNQLTTLNLDNNQIKDIKPLEELQKLKNLTLHFNRITDLSPLKNLHELTDLSLTRNPITDISPLEKLNQLNSLWLYETNIEDYTILNSLTQLRSLELGVNKIVNIPSLHQLKNLEELDLRNNQIADISPLKYLTTLKELNLSNNKIEDISAIKDLKKLKKLQLRGNLITQLPKWITDFNMSIYWNSDLFGDEQDITLFDNPLTNPPIEIVKKGKEAIKRYFEKIEKEGVDYIYEAKLTLVGEGSAGKTSLQKRLLNEKSALPKEDKRTRGIEIKDWEFKCEGSEKHIAHIWDFGGQDVYYPVHRFFLTENSVFVLLASTRQTTHNFEYWIPTIYQFGGKSPIILGQTCHDGNKVPWNDLGTYISKPNFNIIKTQVQPYYEINLPNGNEGLAKIRQTIIDQITSLPRYGRGVPKSWVPVRNILAEESKKTACIPFEKFTQICKDSNPEQFAKRTDITDCCQFLHDIGVVLWYSKNDELKNWVILQPEWAMNAVYKIIDDSEIQKRRGIILAKDFNRLWLENCYDDKHSILKRMLEVFKIAFPKKHKQTDYIIPARLLSMPNENKWPDTEPCLRLEYRYEFMPRGMVNQVSAELSRYITSDEDVWNNAVNFSYDSNTAQCQVEEDFYNRKITIRAKGKDARGLIMLVMDALQNITEGYKGVKPEIHVPCTCNKCKTSRKPSSFPYDDLLRWASDQEDGTVTCNEGRTTLKIDELLYNVGLPNPYSKKTAKTKNKTITLFLASSSELEDDRKEFEIFINRENKQLNKKGVFLNLEIWEDFIDSMSQKGLQSEYNKVVKSCDIFVSLFFTKAGKYTLEEFETAFRQFKETGKPRVYCYFKEEKINIKQIKKEDIQSKFEFEEMLKSLNHYYSTYENMGELKYQFKMQLDKVLPDL